MSAYTDWITAVSAVIAALAASAAVIWNKRAAEENKRSADAAMQSAQAAQAQVQLMKPQPLVIAYLHTRIYGLPDSDSTNIELENIGNATAFDVEIVPVLANEDYAQHSLRATRLETERIPYLRPADKAKTVQSYLERFEGGSERGSCTFWVLLANTDREITRNVIVRFRSLEEGSLFESHHRLILSEVSVNIMFEKALRIS